MASRPSAAVLSLLAAGLVYGGCGQGVEFERTGANVAGGRFEAPAVGRTARVWAVGDAAAPTGRARRVARRVRRGRPELLLYLGDVYEAGTLEEFRRNYRPLFGRLHRRTAPTPGNHEWPLARIGYFPYWRRALGHALPSYYAFNAAGWQILSLNSQGPHGPGSAQARWLERRVQAGGNCRLAFWHRPRYSAGPHGDQPDLQPLWRRLRGHVRLVLNGHDHNLQRMRRRDGITALIAGAGGAGGYRFPRRDPRLVFGNDRVGGALKLRLAPGRARFAFISGGGRVLERGSVRCRRPRR
jgi:calcineurin-like phosphoesterase family protein